MLNRVSKFTIAIILIPVVIGITMAFFKSLTDIGATKGAASRVFLQGVLVYVIVHLFLHKPNFIYTFGHEITHVLATWLCGGKIRSFNIEKKGGLVETTKSNFFITLSPYFIPTYTLILSLLYFVIPFFLKIPNLKSIYLFLAGFTLALHLIFTAEVMKMKQPDILNTGYLFSVILIYIMNLLLVVFVMSFLFEGVSFEDFFYNTYINSKNIYVKILTQLF